MDSHIKELTNNFLLLAKTALTGRQQDVQLLIHRASKKFKATFPDLTDELITLLQESPTRTTPLRKHSDTPLPVDLDSRLQLLRLERTSTEQEPILDNKAKEVLNQVLSERKNTKALLKHGLYPTKSLLFTGPPGVGKTMAAKWVAAKLGRPLLILDLAAVMSSFLGRTGNNIRFVLDYAKNTECVLLLDELDAIAKRRDDASEIGELKRLVTVLLQEIDDWPASGLLIAATNHPDLLDPAIWRRFEVVLNFGNPTAQQRQQLISTLLKEDMPDPNAWGDILSCLYHNMSHSEIERQLNIIRRSAALDEQPIKEKIQRLITDENELSREQRIELARALNDAGIMSQRKINELTGVARDTIRKKAKKTTN
jgi:SpoVK/Ycf46/Vps4 family AAA+-type ATPase